MRDRTGVTDDDANRAVWTIGTATGDAAGKVGGARAAMLALAVARGARWPLVVWRTPLRHVGIPWIADRVYELVAANRHRLPGVVPWCQDHPDECEPEPAS